MTTWRADPDLRGRFHSDHPDDLQVIVHDGEPRRTQKGPEACWVKVSGTHGTLRMPMPPPGTQMPTPGMPITWVERTVYVGTLLNQPTHLTTVRQNATILFVHAPGLPHPLHITEQYRQERSQWVFVACNGCGADQALDPMTIMAHTRFPDAPAGSIPIAFSAKCPCGGMMMLSMVEAPGPGPAKQGGGPTGNAGKKPWWKFW